MVSRYFLALTIFAGSACGSGRCKQRVIDIEMHDVTLEGEVVSEVLARVAEPMFSRAEWHDGTQTDLRIEATFDPDGLHVLEQRWRSGAHEDLVMRFGDRCPNSVRIPGVLRIESLQDDAIQLDASGYFVVGRLLNAAVSTGLRGFYGADITLTGTGPMASAIREDWDTFAPTLGVQLDEEGGTGWIDWEGESCNGKICGLGGEQILSWPPTEEGS